MHSRSTETIADHDPEALAVALMADNPEFAKKLVDAISAKLDEKFGFQQGWMSAQIGELPKKVDGLSSKIDTVAQNIDKRFDTLAHNQKVFAEKQELFELRTDRRLKDINERLGNGDRE